MSFDCDICCQMLTLRLGMRQKKTCTGVNSFWLNILFEVLFNREVYCRVLRIALNPNHFIIYDLFD